jgi:hypothetical protein
MQFPDLNYYKELDPQKSITFKRFKRSGINKLPTNYNITYISRSDSTCETVYNREFLTPLKPTTNLPARLCKDHTKYDTYGCADFETMCINGVHHVISYAFKDHKSSDISYYHIDPMTTNKSNISGRSLDTVLNMINTIQFHISKNLNYLHNAKHYVVYMHNLGGFDGIFIIKALTSLSTIKSDDLKCIFRNGSIYEIKYRKICFRDSLKLLLSPLKSLAKSFGIKIPTETFDYNLLFDINNLTHIFTKTNIRNYNISDVVILDKVLKIVRKELDVSFNIELNECITLSSLSFKIFRKHYLKPNKLYKDCESENVHRFVKQSYRGGIVDVYKPYCENTYSYDINSSYPNSMKRFPMPVGKPV